VIQSASERIALLPSGSHNIGVNIRFRFGNGIGLAVTTEDLYQLRFRPGGGDLDCTTSLFSPLTLAALPSRLVTSSMEKIVKSTQAGFSQVRSSALQVNLRVKRTISRSHSAIRRAKRWTWESFLKSSLVIEEATEWSESSRS
jgi:hypothetical protein